MNVTGEKECECGVQFDDLKRRQSGPVPRPEHQAAQLPPRSGRVSSFGARQWHEKMDAYRAAGGFSIIDRKGNMPMPVTRERESGDDDDFVDIVPEHAGQA